MSEGVCIVWKRPGQWTISSCVQPQETCLYSLLNAALRNHDKRALEPFLPYMKLLLSGLYQLPLKRVRTYRGVKLELYEVKSIL